MDATELRGEGRIGSFRKFQCIGQAPDVAHGAIFEVDMSKPGSLGKFRDRIAFNQLVGERMRIELHAQHDAVAQASYAVGEPRVVLDVGPCREDEIEQDPFGPHASQLVGDLSLAMSRPGIIAHLVQATVVNCDQCDVAADRVPPRFIANVAQLVLERHPSLYRPENESRQARPQQDAPAIAAGFQGFGKECGPIHVISGLAIAEKGYQIGIYTARAASVRAAGSIAERAWSIARESGNRFAQ